MIKGRRWEGRHKTERGMKDKGVKEGGEDGEVEGKRVKKEEGNGMKKGRD